MSQFSVARYYGQCKFNGTLYLYVAEKDELVREDVHKREQAAAQLAAKKGGTK